MPATTQDVSRRDVWLTPTLASRCQPFSRHTHNILVCVHPPSDILTSAMPSCRGGSTSAHSAACRRAAPLTIHYGCHCGVRQHAPVRLRNHNIDCKLWTGGSLPSAANQRMQSSHRVRFAPISPQKRYSGHHALRPCWRPALRSPCWGFCTALASQACCC
jgi:hypothetical protein